MALVLIALYAAGASQSVSGETIKRTIEGGMDVEITYPDTIVAGRDFTVSFLIQNNGWEDKEQVKFLFSPDDAIISAVKSINAGKITAGGSYGETVDFGIRPDASAGAYFLNLDYSQVLLENNETPREALHTNIAIMLNVRESAEVSIHTITPESIFAQAEFPFMIEIISKDEDLRDITVEIIPPRDVGFRGETLHTFSSIKRGEPLSITSRIITPPNEIQTEYKVPFQVLVRYTDDADETHEDSQTVSLVLRPRAFMELATDGGIWIGDFFIAPYVSLGTIIGVPAGAILSLIIRRKTKESKTERRAK